MIKALCVALMSLLAAAVSCAPRERAVVEQERDAVARTVQPITYKRTVAGAQDTITIAQDGAIQTSGRTFGKAEGKLSEFQMLRFARLFENWDKLQDNYPAQKGVPDAGTVAISYGQKTVAASEAAKNLPDQFIQARQRLEALPRELPATR
jgi:hypothetical protein